MTHVIVIGGGAAGLVAARTLAASGVPVTVLEAAAALGGSVGRHEVAGLALDAGAESFATRGGAVVALVDALGLADRVEWPNAAGAWLHLRDRTVPAPKGGLWGIPPDPLAPDVVAAIGDEAAQRAQRDLSEPLPPGFAPATLGELVRERMGAAVLDGLVSPVATGVYSTPADDLTVDAIAPGLRAALQRTGSLARAVRELRGAAQSTRPGAAAGGLRGGMATLIAALADDIRARGGRTCPRARVTGLVRRHDGWDVHIAGNAPDPDAPASAAGDAQASRPERVPRRSDAAAEVLHADAVVVATAQPDAVRLVAAAAHVALTGLDWPAPTRVDLATLVLDAPALDAAPRGTGLLVAADAHDAGRGHPAVAAKALTHATAKWAWLAAQAGAGRHVVRLSYGPTGAGDPAAGIGDDALRDLALTDAAILLGVPLDARQVVGFAHARAANAVSLAARGQSGRVHAVREAVAGVPGLEVTGAWVAGTGLASVVPDAQAAASRIVAELAGPALPRP